MSATESWRRGVLGSMRVRIVAVVVFLLLLSSVGSILLMRAVLFNGLDEEVRVDLEQEAEEFRLLADGINPRTGEPFGQDLEALFDVYFEREVPDEGETLLAFIDGRLYESRRAQDAADADELRPAIEHWLSLDAPGRGVVDTPLGEARYVAVPVTRDSREGLFVVANFTAFERGEINEAVRTELVAQLVMLVVAGLLGLVLAGRVLRPLSSLALTARRISETDLSQRITVSGRDEASQIAATFNEMLSRLERAFATQREFLDDASHELRVPLTVIRGHMELMELDVTPAEQAATVELVIDEVDRMSKMVSDLALLARAEQPGFLTVEPVDLRELVLNIGSKATVLADRDWHVRAPEPATVVADRDRLTQAMLQLAENAVKFTSDGMMIRIGGATEDEWVRLWVDDNGSGVAPEDADRIFQRFDRGGGPRPDGGGRGLGLAIVAAIAEAHQGSARLVPRPGPGARFEITFPTTGEPAERPA